MFFEFTGMTRLLRIVLPSVAASFISSTAMADNSRLPATPTTSLAWSDVWRRIDDHPELAVIEQQSNAARLSVRQSRAIPNPDVDFNIAFGDTAENQSHQEWELGVHMPLDWMGRRKAAIHQRAAEHQVWQHRIKSRRYQLLLAMNQIFWALVHAQEEISTLEALAAETEALAQLVAKRVESGGSRPIDNLRMQIEVDRIAGKRTQAQARRTLYALQLKQWLGLPPDRALNAKAKMSRLPEPTRASDDSDRAHKTHPTIIEADAKVNAAAAAVNTEQKERLPAFGVSAFTTHEPELVTYGIGVDMTLPLWNWNTHAIKARKALLAAEQSQKDVTSQALALDIMESRVKCESENKVAQQFIDTILPNARAHTQTIERTYQLGEATLIDVINARRTQLNIQTDALDALARAQVQCHRLRIQTGDN